MITRNEWKNRVGYHPATPTVGPIHDEARLLIFEAGLQILKLTQPSREQSLAMTHLEEALMWANKCVAIHDSPLTEEWEDA